MDSLRTQLRRAPKWAWEFAAAVGVGIVCIGLSWRMLGMHRGDLSIPRGGGDTLTIYTLAKAMQQHGWYTPNASLGFPTPQDLSPFPNLDLIHLLTLNAFAHLTSNPFAAVNLFNLWGFFVLGALGYLLLRYAGIRPLIAGPLAVSISIAPWHFQRLSGHLFLANYSSLIVGLFIGLFALRVIRSAKDPREAMRGWLVTLILILCSFYVAGGGLYWAFGSLVAIAFMTIPTLLGNRSWRGLWVTAMALAATPAFALMWLKVQASTSTLPVIVQAYGRQFRETELYGGAISTLVLGSPLSGIARIAKQRLTYGNNTSLAINLESGPWNSVIGVIAIICTGVIIIALTSSIWGPVRSRHSPRRLQFSAMIDAIRNEGWLSLFIVIGVIFAVTSFSSLLMLVGFEYIRAWGRFFIEIVIIATVVLGLALNHISAIRIGRTIAIAIAVGLSAIVYVDQVRGHYQDDFGTTAAVAADASALVSEIEASSNRNCGVLMLPVLPFPENGPIGKMKDYDPLWLYVASDSLRFTYGQPKSQPEAEWQNQFAGTLSTASINDLHTAGVCGIVVDTFGYEDPAGETSSIAKLTGSAPMWSPSHRWAYFGITSQ
jgi:hypothetical protein